MFDFLDWSFDVEALRYQFSGVTSLVLAIVFFLLPYDAGYTFIRYAAAVIFLVDAVVKFLDLPVRDLVSALYSFALGVSLVTFFRVFGDPLSQIFGFFFFIDGVLKIIGYSREELRLRHQISAVLTLFLGLSIMFGVLVVHPVLSILLGFLVVLDGLIKLEYLGIL